MKKLLTVSLVAMMAVTTARAEIASKAYVDQREAAAVSTANTYTNTMIGDIDGADVAAAIASAVSGGTANVVTHDGAVGDATTPVFVTAQGVATAGTALGTMAYEAAADYTKSADLGTMASADTADYYTKTAADAAFVEDADIANMQTTTNLSSNMTTDTGSTTKYPSVAAVEAAISASDTAMDSRVDA
ncbi:MAG: hypothetical protein J6Y49_00165, partial [Alphaproteobacteria bacterium]|nr:hypothetical protein [Alphaproteobacteria bacterium]